MKLAEYLIERKIPTRDGKPVPIEKIIGYHVTRVENIDSILKKGFDLSNVKPLWVNDLAVSLNTKGMKAAQKYFSMVGKPFDSEKYAVLKVEVRGRFHKEYDDIRSRASTAQAYNREMIEFGYDAALLPNGHMYVYNIKAIERVTRV